MPEKSYTVSEFASVENITRATVYSLWSRGEGPRYYLVGNRRRITEEMRREWQLAREASTSKSEGK